MFKSKPKPEKTIRDPDKIVKADDPWVTEIGEGLVTFEFLIADVEPDKDKKKHKGGTVDFHVDESGEVFELRLQFQKKEGVTEFRYRVGKLPSNVVRKETKMEVKRGMIMITLKKKDPSVSWDRIMDDTGKLDQSPPPGQSVTEDKKKNEGTK